MMRFDRLIVCSYSRTHAAILLHSRGRPLCTSTEANIACLIQDNGTRTDEIVLEESAVTNLTMQVTTNLMCTAALCQVVQGPSTLQMGIDKDAFHDSSQLSHSALRVPLGSFHADTSSYDPSDTGD